MAEYEKISQMAAASALTGTEKVECVQNGNTVYLTPNQIFTFIPQVSASITEITDATNETETLPNASTTNSILCYGRVGSGSGKLTIQCAGADTINFAGQSVTSIELDESQEIFIWFKSSGTKWYPVSTIGCELLYIGSALECIFTKHLQGTTDADTQTEIAHGITDFDKILTCIGQLSNSIAYKVSDYMDTNSATEVFRLYYTSTDIVFANVGSASQSQNYRVIITYYN